MAVIQNDNQLKKCRCLYCTGECLCYECDNCGHCDGFGCKKATSKIYFKPQEKIAPLDTNYDDNN